MKAELNRIKIALCERKRTGKWLSEKLGANPTTISKWCTNTTQPDLHTLYRIAELLETSVNNLLTDNKTNTLDHE